MDHPPLEKRLAALAEIAREMGRPVAAVSGAESVQAAEARSLRRQ